MNKFKFYLDVFEQGKTFAPLDDLVEAVVCDTAHARDRISVSATSTNASGGCRAVVALALSVAAPRTVWLRRAIATPMLLSLLFI